MPNVRRQTGTALPAQPVAPASPALPFEALTILLCCLALLLISCAGPPPSLPPPAPSPTAIATPAFLTAPLAEAAPQMLLAERQAAGARDLPLLALLWAPDARIVDSRGTEDSGDDSIWDSLPAVLDRYVIAVFPSPPPPLSSADLAGLVIEPEGDRAHLQLGHDRWTLAHSAGRWWLQELRY